MAGNLVIIRTRDVGVYVGEFVSREFNQVTLRNARNLWRWQGANTLLEAARYGVDMEYTRLSEAIEGDSEFFEVGALFPVSEKAAPSLTKSRWPK